MMPAAPLGTAGESAEEPDEQELDDEFSAALARRAARAADEEAGNPDHAAGPEHADEGHYYEQDAGAGEEEVVPLELGGEVYLLDVGSLQVFTLEEEPQVIGFWDPETQTLLPLDPADGPPTPEPAAAPLEEPEPAAAAPTELPDLLSWSGPGGERQPTELTGTVFSAQPTQRAGGTGLDRAALAARGVTELPFVRRELWTDKPAGASAVEEQRAALHGWLNGVLRLAPGDMKVAAALAPTAAAAGGSGGDGGEPFAVEHVELPQAVADAGTGTVLYHIQCLGAGVPFPSPSV